MLCGDFSVTLFGSHGRWREETLSKEDVGYIPQGFGHSVENIGADKARILIDCHQLFTRCCSLREISAQGCISDEIAAL